MSRYYSTPDDVLLFHPIERFLAWMFGKEALITRCEDCNKIPTEVVSGRCEDCHKKKMEKNLELSK